MSDAVERYGRRVEDDPWGVVVEALGYQARNEPLPADLSEATRAAAYCMAGAALVQAGMSVDAVLAKFEGQDHTIRITYDEADGVGLTIDWSDGETTEVAGS